MIKRFEYEYEQADDGGWTLVNSQTGRKKTDGSITRLRRCKEANPFNQFPGGILSVKKFKEIIEIEEE